MANVFKKDMRSYSATNNEYFSILLAIRRASIPP